MKLSDTMKKISLETSLDKANAQASALQSKRDRAIANFAMVDKNGNGKILMALKATFLIISSLTSDSLSIVQRNEFPA